MWRSDRLPALAAAVVAVGVVAASLWFTVGPGNDAPVGSCTRAVLADPRDSEPTTLLPSVRWQPAEMHTGLPDSQEQIMLDVEPFADGFVAVGRWSNGPRLHAFLLRSSDGMRWAGVPEDAKRFAGAELGTLVTVGDRLFAFGSSSVDDRGNSRAAVWYSDDGLAWTEASGPFTNAVATSLAGGEESLLMLGSTASGLPIAWRSSDGSEWTEVRLDLPVSMEQASFGTVAALGDGWHAAGSISNGVDAPAAPVIWRSGDGSGWSCHVLDRGAFGSARATELVAAGDVWLATGSASHGCGIGGSCPGFGVSWVSDGLRWSTAITDDRIAAVGSRVVTDVAGRFVAVDHGTWISADGARWSLLDGPNPVGGATALATDEGGQIVAVGTIYDGSEADPMIAVGELSP